MGKLAFHGFQQAKNDAPSCTYLSVESFFLVARPTPKPTASPITTSAERIPIKIKNHLFGRPQMRLRPVLAGGSPLKPG